MSRVAQATMLLLVVQVLFLQTCAIEQNRRIQYLEGRAEFLYDNLMDHLNKHAIKEAEHHRVDREASGSE